MNLESITKAVEEIVEDIPVTIQINKLTSSYLSGSSGFEGINV